MLVVPIRGRIDSGYSRQQAMRARLLFSMLAWVVGGGCKSRELPRDAPVEPLASAQPPLRDASLEPSCPSEMARVAEFCIDRYEAHLVDADDPTQVLSPYERPAAAVRPMARSAVGIVPQGYL